MSDLAYFDFKKQNVFVDVPVPEINITEIVEVLLLLLLKFTTSQSTILDDAQ